MPWRGAMYTAHAFYTLRMHERGARRRTILPAPERGREGEREREREREIVSKGMSCG